MCERMLQSYEIAVKVSVAISQLSEIAAKVSATTSQLGEIAARVSEKTSQHGEIAAKVSVVILQPGEIATSGCEAISLRCESPFRHCGRISLINKTTTLADGIRDQCKYPVE